MSTQHQAFKRASRADLSPNAYLLFRALDAFLLGWGKTEDVIARSQLLAEMEALRGRPVTKWDFDRARDELVEKGVVAVRTEGAGGRYRETTWAYVLPEAPEKGPEEAPEGEAATAVDSRPLLAAWLSQIKGVFRPLNTGIPKAKGS